MKILVELKNESNATVASAEIDSNGRTGELLFFGVDPDFRGKGYGEKLLDLLIENMRKKNIKNISFLASNYSFWTRMEEKKYPIVILNNMEAILYQRN